MDKGYYMDKQNLDLEKIKKQLHRFEKAQDIVENPVGQIIFSLIDEFPILGAIKIMAESSLDSFQQKKRKKLCNIIFSDNKITEEMVKDVSFIMEFYKLIEVVDRLSTNTRVEYLGNLFKNTVLLETENKYDNFNEYLYRFKKMSEREIEILYMLFEEMGPIKLEELITVESQQEMARTWREFSIKATKHFSIDQSVLISILTGIQRTGFCSLELIHCAGGDMSVFITTKYFRDFMDLVKNKQDNE